MFIKSRIFGLAAATASILALSAPMASAATITNSNGAGGPQAGLVNVNNVQVNPVVCGNNAQVPVNVLQVNGTVPVLNLGRVTTTPDDNVGQASC